MLGALIGAGASIVGGLLSKSGQHSANQMNRQLAREQMAFQERMRNTEYQAAVKDMIAAGINPMMAVSQGGASSPAGASARMENENGPAVGAAIQAFSASMAAKLTNAQVENIEASTVKTTAEAQEVLNRVNEGTSSAGSARVQAATLDRNFDVLGRQLNKLDIEISTAESVRDLTKSQLEQVRPLAVKYQELLNEGLRLGLTEKQVNQKFLEQGGEFVKWLSFIKSLLK